eukprot:1175833-Prorocentrum_minimum.AAC.2
MFFVFCGVIYARAPCAGAAGRPPRLARTQARPAQWRTPPPLMADGAPAPPPACAPPRSHPSPPGPALPLPAILAGGAGPTAPPPPPAAPRPRSAPPRAAPPACKEPSASFYFIIIPGPLREGLYIL